MNARAALEAIDEYLSAKSSLAVDAEHRGEEYAESILNEIAERFKEAMKDS